MSRLFQVHPGGLGDVASVRTALTVAVAVTAACLPACVDAAHEDEVSALGDEAPGVPRGPLHRPGQPCLVCHGALGPASAQFVMAGTVYAKKGQRPVSIGATVSIEDFNGSVFMSTTNEAGNFFITTSQWTPRFPALPTVQQGQSVQQMTTYIASDGSCAGCHSQRPSPTSPGPVYVALAASPVAASPEGGP